VLPCESCGGVLKPDVVFFGENVPRERVELCYALVEEAEALLVAGSSLTVMSGLRFVRAAHRRGIPVVIVNRGPTRGDDLASVHVDDGCSSVLGHLADAVVPARS
jgi:NAD-dependent SIR2 family protein deacetylase